MDGHNNKQKNSTLWFTHLLFKRQGGHLFLLKMNLDNAFSLKEIVLFHADWLESVSAHMAVDVMVL